MVQGANGLRSHPSCGGSTSISVELKVVWAHEGSDLYKDFGAVFAPDGVQRVADSSCSGVSFDGEDEGHKVVIFFGSLREGGVTLLDGLVVAEGGKVGAASAVGRLEPMRRDRPDYDMDHYTPLLVTSYASRLRKAFAPQDWEQLFPLGAQLGPCDLPTNVIEPFWICCGTP